LSFLKKEEQDGKTGTVWGWYHWDGEDIRKGYGRVNMVEICYTLV
jgi:hypothetical protein